MWSVAGQFDLEAQALGERQHRVLAHDVRRLQGHSGHAADRREVPHPRRFAGRDHRRQEGPHAVEDPADVDVDQSIPVLDRGVPQIPELLDARVVDQQPHRSDIAVRALGQCSTASGSRTSHTTSTAAPRRRQLVAERGDRGDVDVGEHHRHSKALAWRASPAPMPAPAPVMTATPPPKVSRASRAGDGRRSWRVVFGEGNRILGVEHHTHRREHQAVDRHGGCRRRPHRWTRRTGRCW